MREIEGLMIKYLGHKEPATEEEVELEILGLQTAVAAAKQRISVLRQSLKLQEIVLKSKAEGTDEKTVAETPPETEKTE